MTRIRTLILGGLAAALTIGTAAEAVQAQNPIVGGRGWQRWGYNPWQDHWYRDRYRERARESAFDWDRSHIDPGSYHYVDRHVRDERGRLVREYGPTWTSHGKPHGRLTRERVTHYPGRGWGPGYTERDRDVIIYSQTGAEGPTRGPRPVPPRPVPPAGGGLTERDRDVIIHAQPAQPGQTQR